MKELVMICRCIGQWLQGLLLHSNRSWLPKTTVTLYLEGLKTYTPQPTNNTRWNDEIEVLRRTLDRKSEIHVSYVFGVK